LHASMLAKTPGPRFVVHGTKGTITINGLDPQESQLKDGMLPTDAGFGTTPTRFGLLTVDDEKPEQVTLDHGKYVNFYENIADAILNGSPLAVPSQQGSMVIKIIEAAMESAKTGRTVTV
jgi:scyllo-inositol 2-dehydrogenase (NADP+)